MTPRKYHTLIVWDTDQQCWMDEFGDYRKADVVAERQGHSAKGKHKLVISHDDTAAAMMQARDATPAPK